MISTCQNFEILCLLLRMCQNIPKICVVFETHKMCRICRLHYRLQGDGVEVFDVIFAGVPEQRDET